MHDNVLCGPVKTTFLRKIWFFSYDLNCSQSIILQCSLIINIDHWLACICGTVLMKMTMMTFSSSTPIYQKTEVNFFQLILEVVVQFLRQYKLTGNSSAEVYPDPAKHLILCVLKTLHLKCLKVFLIRFWSSIRNNVFW